MNFETQNLDHCCRTIGPKNVRGRFLFFAPPKTATLQNLTIFPKLLQIYYLGRMKGK